MRDDRKTPPLPKLAKANRLKNNRTLTKLTAAPIIPLNDNLISRPWGGRRLRSYKQIPETSNLRVGEAFEICAFEGDEEAAAHPSEIRLDDGSTIGLPELLAAAGPLILGQDHVRTHGCQLPLLPKTLDVDELLSIQTHPEGLTEVYIVIEADEGATIRLGFNRDIDRAQLAQDLKEGCRLQAQLLGHMRNDASVDELQSILKKHFAQRKAPAAAVLGELESLLSARSDRMLVDLLERLKGFYWQVLDLMNEVKVVPGQVIYNANPVAVGAASGRPRSAEIHALGNPEGREILALEIRRPGPTFRAWDNVRFPRRPVDIDKALADVNLTATRPEDFIVTPEPLDGRPGVFRSVRDEGFTVFHLRPRPRVEVRPPLTGQWHTLHTIRGSVDLQDTEKHVLAPLSSGQSALIPMAMGAYQITTDDDDAEVIMVAMI